MILIIIWLLIGYGMLILNGLEIPVEELNTSQIVWLVFVFAVAGPVFLINNIFLTILDFVLGGDIEDDS